MKINIFILSIIVATLAMSSTIFAQAGAVNTSTINGTQIVKHQCNDEIDNDGDGKADSYGVDTSTPKDGIIDLEPDPNCFTTSAQKGIGPDGGPVQEKKDDVVSSIIPCTDKCTFTDVFRLLNNALEFFIKTLMIPIFIIIVMYAGYQYIMAGTNGGKKANIKKMLGHIVGGMILILCAWLIVRTIMTTLLNDQYKQSGIEFLSQ